MPPDPARYLAGLNDAQREAATATSGPVVILAAAGTGKTRVVTRRTAYAITTGVVAPDDVLLVTFTEKAAGELRDRIARLGFPGVAASTFHAAAYAWLRYFWPRTGAEPPSILESKLPIVGPLARRLPGGYRFTAAKDLADAIERAKVRRLRPETFARLAAGSDAPIPPELFARLWADYEEAKARRNLVDFEDLLVWTVELLEADEKAREVVRARRRWFCVDEYQDTNPLQQAFLELWVGDRRDLCVVGDEDQAIYTFAGATPEYLQRFAERYPGAQVIRLAENYRSSPQILALPNRLLASAGSPKRLLATRPPGPTPTITGHADEAAELASLVGWIRARLGEGIDPAEIAVLVRLNAQLPPIEAALTAAGIRFRLRGGRFWERPEIRAALRLVRRADPGLRGRAIADAVAGALRTELGYDPDSAEDAAGEATRERAAALGTFLAAVADAVAADSAIDAAGLAGALEARAAAERTGEATGVSLLTLHRAKGLEWDAVALPSLEEGLLPVRHARDAAGLDEERRLLYVGLTRARLHLALSWAAGRAGPSGRETDRTRSRFLTALEKPSRPATATTVTRGASPVPGAPASDLVAPAEEVSAALRAWRRERAAADGVPAFVVAEDRTLAAIADARPRTLEELEKVRGMGPKRVARYGNEILAVIGRTTADAAQPILGVGI